MRCLAPTSQLDASTSIPRQNSLPQPREPTRTELPPPPTDSHSEVPIVQLQVDSITDELAARLATSLLGHVLFLKNQTPFPVAQLGRLPGNNKAGSKAAKHRAELLASFDTLASHLTTTFTALSTAFAQCARDKKQRSEKIPAEDHGACAYLAILLGPSLGTAKSRVFLAVDSFETRVWGLRDDEPEGDSDECETEEEDDGEEDSDSETSEGDHDEPEESEEEDDEDEDATALSESEEEHPLEDDEDKIPHSARLKSPPPAYTSYAEEQRFLQNSERLLSRTLAASDANGYGFASEMSPTQTHILIRAPRCFSHPAWIPRQNVTCSLETSLHEFLVESGQKGPDDASLKKSKKRARAEGVWITGRSGLSLAPKAQSNLEGDEMIWWSWDGKIVGFADW